MMENRLKKCVICSEVRAKAFNKLYARKVSMTQDGLVREKLGMAEAPSLSGSMFPNFERANDAINAQCEGCTSLGAHLVGLGNIDKCVIMDNDVS